MITRAIIEERIDQFHYRVRIPIFDRVEESPTHTQFDDLCQATVCMPKGINNNIKTGDIVFVGFEDNTASQPVILGQLYREALTKDSEVFLNITNLTVDKSVTLPFGTTIGNISFQTLWASVQKISDLENKTKELENKIKELEQKNL